MQQRRLVIADTGPVNYLIQIGHIDLLPLLFDRIAIPNAVETELSHALAPASVRLWITNAPAWLEIQDIAGLPGHALPDDFRILASALGVCQPTCHPSTTKIMTYGRTVDRVQR